MVKRKGSVEKNEIVFKKGSVDRKECMEKN